MSSSPSAPSVCGWVRVSSDGSKTISGEQQRIDRVGLVSALAAYGAWGFMPVFFKQLAAVPALEIISHRVVWAVPLLIAILAVRKQLAEFRHVFASWPQLRWMLASAVLISANWLIYVWAVNNGHILASSFGYYLNPLLNIVMGTIFLKEQLNRAQLLAFGVAALGVLVMGAGALDTLWISLSLAASFCAYGLVRKFAPVGAVPGLAIETSLLLPIAMAGAFWFVLDAPHPGWGSDARLTWLLAAGGAVTAFPLLLFATAARRLDYSTLGFIQYLAPTIQFLCGWLIYDEVLSTERLISFILIWTALSIFSFDAVRRMRGGVSAG
ncbi:MAG: EamA family transporter RarD [Sphingorhabdus sp.]